MKDHDPPSPARPRNAVAEEQLHAFVDGRLDAAARAAVEQSLDDLPDQRETAQAWAAQREQLRGLHTGLLHEEPPAFFKRAADQAGDVRGRTRRGWQLATMAASVLLAFGAGWLGHGLWRGQPAGGAMAQFARQAVVAHVVYTPEVRHPVEVTAAQQEHLVQWLSKRLGQPLKVPALSAHGFELVGGRLLPGSEGARAQFMFQNTQGERLTLYVGALEASGETAFRFAQDGALASFYWVDQGAGYALSGPLPRAALLDIANDVYRQLALR